MATVRYMLLSDIDLDVKVRVTALLGKRPKDLLELQSQDDYSPITHTREDELYVVGQLYSSGKKIGLAASTTYKCFSHGDIWWGEWLTFPVKYRDLSPTSRLVLTVYDITHCSTSSKGSTDQRGCLPPPIDAVVLGGTCLPLFNQRGLLKLGRRKLLLWPGMAGDGSVASQTPYKTGKAEGVDRLDKLIRRYEQRDVPTVSWMDKLALRRIEALQLRNEPADGGGSGRQGGQSGAPIASSLGGSRGTQTPRRGKQETQQQKQLQQSKQAEEDEDPLLLQPSGGRVTLGVEFPPFRHPIVFHQKTCNPAMPEILPTQDRLFVLHDPEMVRDNPVEMKYHKLARSSKGLADRDLKPKIIERKLIHAIISSPNKHLSGEDKQLLWKFRFSLLDNKRALTKFLRCVDWADGTETAQALELLDDWAPIDIADALELLSKFFTHPAVRVHAVRQLERAGNDELESYLLQLVQALRYEATYPSSLSQFLIQRCTETLSQANFFHWFLAVESAREDNKMAARFADVLAGFKTVLKANQPQWHRALEQQEVLIGRLIELGAKCNKGGGKFKGKKERMKQLLKDGGEMHDALCNLPEPVHLPVRPNIKITGLVPEKTRMFKSALAPICSAFNTTEGGEPFKVIFKSGDDLRQDQLIIQMINLMDSLLKKVNLDLRLTPYVVLATGAEDGFVEFVPRSHTLTDILEKHNKDIRKFFHEHNESPRKLQEALETFVRSCAGYCVITYILGIGDRHLENVLLTTSGELFHIDFGFIFGRDPKPFPPPMKFSKEMVEAMGGANSSHYMDFKKYAVLAFNILRKHSSLILNLLNLMGDANIPDLSGDVDRVLLKVQDKFRLDLTDEQAETYILDLIESSVNALFPVVIDKIHKWAMYWK